jgi:dipeptidyl aminopeptidase/acylaminoacyl peptidase
MNVQYFFWASADSIVYSNSRTSEDSLRIFVVDIHNEQSSSLMPTTHSTLRWISPARFIDGELLVMMNIRDSSVFDLYRLPADGSGPILFEENRSEFSSWYRSTDGKIRLALSSDSIQEALWYRADENQPYQMVLQTDYSAKVYPLGPVFDMKDQIYALSNIGRDKFALVKLDLITGKETQVLYESEENDLNREGYSFERQEVLLSSIYEQKKKTVIHNDELADIFERIRHEFKGYSVDIVDVDQAFNTVIFRTYTDVYPGGFYYYYKPTDKIVELYQQYPSLADKDLSEMKEITFNSRDGREIHGYLTYPSQRKSSGYPMVVLVHDGPNRRDVWGFNAEVQFLASRGYLVFQVNYRGSIGFGKEFFAAGFKEWGGNIQNDINDGVTWLINQGIADKNNIAIMGTGFGGYSALYAACFHPTLYKCVVSSSGYTNLFTYFKEIPPYFQSRIKLYHQIIGDPQKESDLFKAISPLFHAENIRTPLLMFQGGKDRYNSTTDVNQLVQRVKNSNVPVRYIYYEDEGKRFKKEENIVTYYQEVEKFLSTYLK